jgi:hypothetical protein
VVREGIRGAIERTLSHPWRRVEYQLQKWLTIRITAAIDPCLGVPCKVFPGNVSRPIESPPRGPSNDTPANCGFEKKITVGLQ